MSDDIYKGHFVFAEKRPAWHRKGYELTGEETFEESMRLAGVADWDVKAIPLDDLVTDTIWSMEGNPVWQDGYGLNVVTRMEDGKRRPLTDQLVRGSWVEIQNEDVLDRMVPFLTAHSGITPDAMGVLGRLGNRVFVTFDMGEYEAPGNEKYQNYLVAIVDHTGRGAVRFLRTSIRVVCANTEYMAIGQAQRSGMMVSIHHSQKALDDFWSSGDSMREILVMSEVYNKNLVNMVESLQRVAFSKDDWQFFLDELERPVLKAKQLGFTRDGRPFTERMENIHHNQIYALEDSWGLEEVRAEALGQSGTTLWTAKQAISTYAQHLAPGGPNRKLNRQMSLMEGASPGVMHSMTSTLKRTLPVDWFDEDAYAFEVGWL